MDDSAFAGRGETVKETVERSLVPRIVDLPPARFALELRPGQDLAAVAESLRGILPDLGAVLAPLSALEPGIVVVELPRHGLRIEDPATVFAAGYALAETLEVAAAEPDLPTDFFPEEPPAAPDVGLRQESLGGVLGGCWVAREPHLDGRPGWALETIRAVQAWRVSAAQGRPSRGRGILIAQPDTGITAHAELRGVNSASGFDFLGADHDPTDPLTGANPGHGTATASVAVSPPMLRVTGSAPDAAHMPLRAIESVVRVTQVTVARSIDWAVEHGAAVITMSLGGIPSFSLHRAVRRAVAADVIVLAAAGNCVGAVVWPARYDECIAVAGTNAADARWPGSCQGAAVDISAPGQNVFHADVPAGSGAGGEHVNQGQGTSLAVALTAGAAALWLAHHGRANLVRQARARGETLQVMFRRLLQATSRRPLGWNSFQMGPGIVNAEALLLADLDLGRDREAVDHVLGAPDSEMTSVASLVAELVNFDAVDSTELDWHRFGPELATALLHRAAAASADVQPELPGAATVTEQLGTAVDNEYLRGWLGLPPVEAAPTQRVGEKR
ncbi:S8 family peptidase [Kocuria sp. LHG3120]|uniref:S8 family peptidase n=1 Tax=Kocuria sp. LHG3120 TaxID=2804590 RepID=UPI003CF5092A